jgi:hypothetical protein
MRYVLLAALTLSAVAAHADHEDNVTVQIGEWQCEGVFGVQNPPCPEVRFDRPFATAPKIAISFSEIHHPLQAHGLPAGGSVSIKASNITKDGFLPVVSSDNVEGPYTGSWIAVGQ